MSPSSTSLGRPLVSPLAVRAAPATMSVAAGPPNLQLSDQHVATFPVDRPPKPMTPISCRQLRSRSIPPRSDHLWRHLSWICSRRLSLCCRLNLHPPPAPAPPRAHSPPTHEPHTQRQRQARRHYEPESGLWKPH